MPANTEDKTEAPKTTSIVEPKGLAIKFDVGPEGVRRVYSNNGLVIETGQELRITSHDLPEDFPYKLSELATQLRQIEGMEVTAIDNLG
ncbi:MAG: hypothetical protein ABFD83_14795 [Armatimonadota bacterium]